MWREQLDVFWDGDRSLLLCFFETGEPGGAKIPRPDLTIVSAGDPEFSGETAFVDRLDAARWRAGACLVVAPPGQRHFALLAPDGAELRLCLETDPGDVGDWRLTLTLLADNASAAPAALRVASFSGREDFERFAREQFALAGSRLVWACAQKRLFGQGDGSARLLHLWPVAQMFPASRARLSIEALEFSTESVEDSREAPFAIMDQWLREGGAPRAGLRLRFSDSLEESAHLLSRISVFMAMRQRRRLRDWMREQREAGEPVIEPILFDDIRQATGMSDEHPDAVRSPEPIVVFNLLKLLTASEETSFDGVAVRRLAANAAVSSGGGAVLELDFYGAALGDEIGLVSAGAETGEFLARSRDPGGASNIRLFRLEGDGVNPRRIDAGDTLVEEILSYASDGDGAPAGAMSRAVVERAAGLHARREKLLHALNAALKRLDYPSGFDVFGVWEPLEPLLASNFVSLLKEADPAGRALAARLGGYKAYRIDPSLLSALVLRPLWGEGLTGPLRVEAQAPLVYRFAQACGVPGMVAPQASVHDQARIFDMLMETRDPASLRAAHLQLDGQAGADPSLVAAALQDVGAIEQAAAFYEEHGPVEHAEALRRYLGARVSNVFTPLGQAAPLVAVIGQALEAIAQAERERLEPPPPPQEPPPPKPKGLFAAIRGLFGG